MACIKLILSTVVLILLTLGGLEAQSGTIVYDAERNYFNDNQPIPSEKQLLFTGKTMPGVVSVEIKIFNSKGKEDRKALYSASWKKPYDKTGNTFELPVNYKLRAGSDYDFQISSYRAISNEERGKLKKALYENMEAYINLTFNQGNKKVKFTKNNRQVMNDMNSIVENGLTYFQNLSFLEFQGFSDLIHEKIKEIEGQSLQTKQSKNAAGELTDKFEARDKSRTKLIGELKKLIFSELEQFLNTNWGVLADQRYVNDYPTEKQLNVFSINGGYGGVLLSGVDSLNLGGAPYIGLSFPLGKKAMSSPFWSNTSLNVGVFLNNFKDESSGLELTGPIFKRPYYVGMGYKVFQFIRVNAGATFLEDVSTAGIDLTNFNDRVNIRPFVGISAELNLWAAFAK